MGNKAIKLKDKNDNTFYPCPYYPVGSIYMNANNVNPSEYFGGEWEQIKDVFLLCAGDKYEAGSTGGEAEHKLSLSEIPSHKHGVWYLNNNGYDNTDASITLSSVGKHYSSTAYYTNNQGGGQAHNNMPPYKTIYVWQRIA